MNKTRIILSVIGGVAALIVLVAAYLAWDAFSSRTAALEGSDEADGLATVVRRLSALQDKKPYPSLANKALLERNRQAVEAWRQDALRLAARGDWCADAACTPAQFKERIARDAKAMKALTGPAGDPVVAADFAFGPFKDYLADKMPTREQLARLQRQWFDVTSLIELLATNGVTQVTDVQSVVQAVVEEQPERGKKASKKKAKGNKAAKAAKAAFKPSVETYALTFLCAPAAFVEVVRQLSFQDRFTVVDSFTFLRERDAVATILGGSEKGPAKPAQSSRRRRRGQRAEAAEEAAEAAEQTPEAIDPRKDAAMRVTLTVSVYDFRSLESDEEKEEISK